MTNPQIERMAGFIRRAIVNLQAMQEDGVDSVEDVSDMVDTLAQAAYDASDARLVPMLVEALVIAKLGYGDDCADQEGLDLIRQALEALPEEYR